MKFFQTDSRVSANGRIDVSVPPFQPGEDVHVIVVSSSFGNAANRTLEMVLRFVDPDAFSWNGVPVPEKPTRFEDLTFLFGASPLTRGIIRLDIDEAGAVFKTIRRLPRPKGAEVGRFRGGSTFLLAAAVGDGGRLLSVDVAPQNDKDLQAALQKAGLSDRVELIVADGSMVGPDGNLDFVFIDGDHSYDAALRDHNHWGRAVRPGGLILHHDMGRSRPFSTQLPALARLRTEILRVQAGIVELLEEAGSLSVFRRTHHAWMDLAEPR